MNTSSSRIKKIGSFLLALILSFTLMLPCNMAFASPLDAQATETDGNEEPITPPVEEQPILPETPIDLDTPDGGSFYEDEEGVGDGSFDEDEEIVIDGDLIEGDLIEDGDLSLLSAASDLAEDAALTTLAEDFGAYTTSPEDGCRVDQKGISVTFSVDNFAIDDVTSTTVSVEITGGGVTYSALVSSGSSDSSGSYTNDFNSFTSPSGQQLKLKYGETYHVSIPAGAFSGNDPNEPPSPPRPTIYSSAVSYSFTVSNRALAASPATTIIDSNTTTFDIAVDIYENPYDLIRVLCDGSVLVEQVDPSTGDYAKNNDGLFTFTQAFVDKLRTSGKEKATLSFEYSLGVATAEVSVFTPLPDPAPEPEPAPAPNLTASPAPAPATVTVAQLVSATPLTNIDGTPVNMILTPVGYIPLLMPGTEYRYKLTSTFDDIKAQGLMFTAAGVSAEEEDETTAVSPQFDFVGVHDFDENVIHSSQSASLGFSIKQTATDGNTGSFILFKPSDNEVVTAAYVAGFASVSGNNDATVTDSSLDDFDIRFNAFRRAFGPARQALSDAEAYLPPANESECEIIENALETAQQALKIIGNDEDYVATLNVWDRESYDELKQAYESLKKAYEDYLATQIQLSLSITDAAVLRENIAAVSAELQADRPLIYLDHPKTGKNSDGSSFVEGEDWYLTLTDSILVTSSCRSVFAIPSNINGTGISVYCQDLKNDHAMTAITYNTPATEVVATGIVLVENSSTNGASPDGGPGNLGPVPAVGRSNPEETAIDAEEDSGAPASSADASAAGSMDSEASEGSTYDTDGADSSSVEDEGKSNRNFKMGLKQVVSLADLLNQDESVADVVNVYSTDPAIVTVFDSQDNFRLIALNSGVAVIVIELANKNTGTIETIYCVVTISMIRQMNATGGESGIRNYELEIGQVVSLAELLGSDESVVNVFSISSTAPTKVKVVATQDGYNLESLEAGEAYIVIEYASIGTGKLEVFYYKITVS